MSSIDKLSIQGIRSFDPKVREVIKFDTPLTLIVGHNGSGKTTIIECLKYATIGQLPPNSKGGAFIHDPDLAGAKEVMAQVKLLFKSGENKLTITRSVSLTVKKTTRAFKTLDSTLKIEHDGQAVSHSSKVAELDEMVLQHLGVSNAVLDSVIFCHQDDSLWPMSEPAVLKKKFDEIFEAGKYTKAIEKIKKIKKEQDVELKQHKLREGFAKENKDKAARSEKKQLALQDEIEKLREEAESLGEEKDEIEKTKKGKEVERDRFIGILNTLQSKRDRQRERQSNVDDLKINLKELSDSDESLQAALAQHNESMKRVDEEEAQLTRQYNAHATRVSQCRKDLSDKLAKQGVFQAKKEEYERQLHLRVELIKESASKHGIRGYEGDIEEHQIQEFMDKIAKMSLHKQREQNRVESETNEAINTASAALTDVRSRVEARTQAKKSANDSIKANFDKIKLLQRQIDAITVYEGTKAELETSCKQRETQLQTATSEFNKEEWESDFSKENARLGELEAKIENLLNEQGKITQIQQERVELDMVTKDLKSKQQSIKTMVDLYRDRIGTAVGANWKPETVENDFQSALSLKSRAVEEVARVQAKLQSESSNYAFKLKGLQDTFKKKVAERNSCEKKVIESIEDLTSTEDFEAELAAMEENRKTLQTDIEMSGQFQKFWAKCLKVMETKDKCHVCERRFSGEQEKSVAVDRTKKQMLEERVEDWKTELAFIEEALKKAHAARPLYDVYKRLSTTEIPSLRDEVKQTDNKHKEVVARLEKQDSLVEEAEASKTELEALGKPITNIARQTVEISDLNRRITSLSSQQKVSSSMSLDEIQSQHKDYSEQKRATMAKINELQNREKHAIEQIHKAEFALQEAKSQLDKTTYQLEKKNGLAQQAQELKNDNVKHREDARQAEDDLGSLEDQVRKAREELNDVRGRGEKKQKIIRDDNSSLSNTKNKLQNVEGAINQYLENGGTNNLIECQREIKGIHDEISREESEAKKVDQARHKLKEQKAHGEETKRCIADNIAYRRNLSSLQKLNAEIAELVTVNADEDYERLNNEVKALVDQHTVLGIKQSSALGTLSAKDDELKHIIDEWESDYKDASRKYREAHIKFETTKAAIEDLGKYATALDQAIMKYHGMKMEEINRIAGELWQNTYQGTDVDTILIRSDSENAKGNRNYNYRVCMVKQDVEMDMRGRCSAGQRVLASIIIRLALAECFGTNCGIIALDEPTTNLDQENIRSLAKSLHDIIEARKVQKNFQLIIITHDEEFLKEMRCDSFSDNYWRVSRNDEQKSIIRMQSIKEVL